VIINRRRSAARHQDHPCPRRLRQPFGIAQEVDTAVTCMREGAFDHLVKPV